MKAKNLPIKTTTLLATFTAIGIVGGSLAAESEVPYPADYRTWHHVKSMVTEEGHALFSAVGGYPSYLRQ